MHIEVKTALAGLLVAGLLGALDVAGQDADTIETKPFERYWTKARVVPKIGLGIQETAFAEVGVQLHQIYIHPLSLASAGPYLTLEAMARNNDVIMGPKLGYQITAGLIGLAADFTYYSDFEDDALMFTPRAGLSILGFVDLFYGRNIAVSESPFDFIDQNRFSLVFNLNRDYFNLKEAPRRTRK